MREEPLFKTGKKDQRKLQALGGVQSHERDPGFGIELVGVGGQGGVVEELGQRFAAGFGIVGGVGQFLQVFNAAEGFRRALGLERLDVAGPVDEEADQFGKRGGVAGGAKRGLFFGCIDSCRLDPGFVDSQVSMAKPGALDCPSAFSETGVSARRQTAKNWRRRATEAGPHCRQS